MGALVTRDHILRETARWRGTPVRWEQCARGHAVDCKGLIAGVAAALDLPEARSWAAQARTYRRSFRAERMLEGLEDTFIRVDEPQPADVLAIIMGRKDTLPRHLGIVTRPGWMMHAYGGGVARVCEVPYGQRRIHSFWTWPSLGEHDG